MRIEERAVCKEEKNFPVFGVCCTWVRMHFERYKGLSQPAFLWSIALETFILSTVVLTGATLLLGLKLREFQLDEVRGYLLASITVVPLLETALFQLIPIGVVSRLGARRTVQIGVSVVLFAVVHFLTVGPATGIAAGLVAGFYFAFTYTHWRNRSLKAAYWMTAAHHGLYNGITCSLILLYPG